MRSPSVVVAAQQRPGDEAVERLSIYFHVSPFSKEKVVSTPPRSQMQPHNRHVGTSSPSSAPGRQLLPGRSAGPFRGNPSRATAGCEQKHMRASFPFCISPSKHF